MRPGSRAMGPHVRERVHMGLQVSLIAVYLQLSCVNHCAAFRNVVAKPCVDWQVHWSPRSGMEAYLVRT